MADVELNLGSGGKTVRTIEKSAIQTQVVTLDVGGAGAESLVSGTVPVSGTVTANLGATDNAVLDDIASKVDRAISSDAAIAVTVAGTGLTTLATIANTKYTRLQFQCDVVTQNVDDFEIQVKGHASALSMVITPTSWTSLPNGGYVRATGVHTTSSGAYVDGDLNTIDAGQSGFFDMDITGFTEIIVKVSAASDSASVTPRWTLSR